MAPRPNDAEGLEGGPCGHIRLFSGEGSLLSLSSARVRVSRHTASLCFALDEPPLRLRFAGGELQCRAVALRPFHECEFACDQAFACVDLLPTHPRYRIFTTGGPALELPEPADALLASLREFHAGGMTACAAYGVFGQAIAFAQPWLPAVPPADRRVLDALWELYRQPTLALASVAARLGLSADRLSHLFAREMGFTLRRYVQALKVVTAGRYYGSGKSLTEIAVAAGFADLAHFSKVWRRCYGTPPAFYFQSGALRAWPPEPCTSVLWDPPRS